MLATEAYERVVCSECGQVVALRRRNQFDPLGATITLDSRGRPVIICPVCKRSVLIRRDVDVNLDSA